MRVEINKIFSWPFDEVNQWCASCDMHLGNLLKLLVACYKEGSHKALYDKSEVEC